MSDEQKIEELARSLYEASRKRVSGRPAWEKLDPMDGYDMGMRAAAMAKARESLST